MVDNEKIEDLSMLIIANAGAARSGAFAALGDAKQGRYTAAREKLAEAQNYSQQAHAAHSELLKLDAKGEVECVDLLMSHAQDHLMNAALALELITEIIGLYEIIKEEVK